MVLGCTSRGVRAEKITPEEACKLEPGLDTSDAFAAVHLPDDGQIRTPRFSKALALSCRQREAVIKEGVSVVDICVENGKAVGVVDVQGNRYPAGKIVLCTGAWTRQFKALTQAAPRTAKIEPVRGQIVCYKLPAPLGSRLITIEKQYVVQRPDGILLIGSTTEYVDYESVTTVEGQALLMAFGRRLFPALNAIQPLQGWADLRPGLKGRHPILGPVPGIEGLYVAAGHYRNGLLLAPITAELMTAVLTGETPRFPIEHYRP
jgi:glycine oxidase